MGRAFTVKTVHKGMYPATYNFKDEADGTTGTSIVFIDVVSTAANTTIVASFVGHRKVLKQTNIGGNDYCDHSFTQATAGTHEWWWSPVDATKQTRMSFAEDGTFCILIRPITDKYYYFNGADYIEIVGAIPTDNEWDHFKVQWYADNTFDVWINGILLVDGVAMYNNQVSGLNKFRLQTYDTTSYIDAYGEAEDTDYNIGDNVFWRHLKESTDSFEGDDVGTQGTSITWVDIVDIAASTELVQEFNAHKKILRQDYTSAVGGFDYCYHTFPTQAKDGWFSFWIKVTDVTGTNEILLYDTSLGGSVTYIRINGNQFQKYTGGAWSQIAGSPTPVNDTWYFIYLKWTDAATDTITCLIDNIEYETFNAQNNQTNGINSVYINAYASGDYVYIDAPMSSLDSDERAYNRTFEYNNTYTKTDITTDVKNVNYENKIYSWRTATLYAKSSYEFTNVFFEIYDVNSKLAMRGEIKNRILERRIYRYPLRDMNWDDLNESITNVFTTDKIHDPTDSTSMLKTALPNVDQTEGDLILADADTEAATYSPTLRFYPTHMFLRDISDLADSVTIIKASGIILLDDDLVSGDSLDVDVEADKRKMSGEPIPTDILETINYFEILGAINPDTGQRFYKLIDNSGDDKKRPWRYVNNEFTNQTDVDAYAAALALRTVPVRIIRFSVQNLGVHDMGTTLDYKYIKGVINIAQANYYIISETINFDANLATIVLSEGLIESSKYSASFERPENYVNSFGSKIYETDIVTVYPHPRADTLSGASVDGNGRVQLDANGEIMTWSAYLDGMVDTTRAMILTIVYVRIDAGADTITGNCSVYAIATYGDSLQDTVVNNGNPWDSCAAGKTRKMAYTIPKTDINPEDYLVGNFHMLEAGKDIRISTISLRYFVKRSI